jgi:hypothetical protein
MLSGQHPHLVDKTSSPVPFPQVQAKKRVIERGQPTMTERGDERTRVWAMVR